MSYLDQAKSLCILKGALGPVFEAQKALLLDNFVAEFVGKVVDASPFLSEFSAIGFISADEIPPLLTRISQSGSLILPSPSSSSSSSPLSWEQLGGSLREDSPLDSQFFSAFFAKEGGEGDKSTLEALKNGLEAYGAETLGDVIQLKLQDDAFSVLENVLPLASAQSLFHRLCDQLLRLPCFIKSSPSSSSSSSPLSSLPSSAFYVYGQDTQMMVIDNDGKQNVFCLVERGDDEDENENDANNEVILFYLDTSSSMNADEHGRYLPPHSEDHPSSSIKKARDLIPPLVRGAVKRGKPFFFLSYSLDFFYFPLLFLYPSLLTPFFPLRCHRFCDSLEHHTRSFP